MNLTTRIKEHILESKNVRAEPKYTLNVSIDIPLNSKYIINQQKTLERSGISSRKNKQQFQVSILSVKQKKESQVKQKVPLNILGKKHLPYKNINSNKKIINHEKYNSCQIFPKRIRKKSLIKTFREENLIANINSQDSIIKYTHESSTQYQNINKNRNLIINEMQTQEIINDLNFQEIRQYQKLANDKKEHINYKYLKQKLLILSCVKKIQRAWRNYKTRKLVKIYSHNSKIIYKKNINDINFIGDKQQIIPHQFQTKKYSQKSNQSSNRSSFFQKSIQGYRNELVEFESEQMKKWDQLIQQIQSGKPLEQVLEKSYQRRQEIQKQLRVYNYEIQKDQLENESLQSQQKDKIKIIQGKLRIIQNQNGEQETLLISTKQKQQIQNQNLRRKLQIFHNLEEFQIDRSQAIRKRQVKQQKKQIKQEINQKYQQIAFKKKQNLKKLQILYIQQNNKLLKLILIAKQQIAKNKYQSKQNLSIQEKAQLQSTGPVKQYQQSQKNIIGLKKRIDLLQIKQQLDLCKIIVEQLIFEIFLDFSEFPHLINSLKPIFEKKKKPQKLQGICTNLESIKDYLENLVTYVLDLHFAPTLTALSTPLLGNYFELMNYFRNQIRVFKSADQVLEKSIFTQHWQFVSDQIYFDRKYQDDAKQYERIKHLKTLTNIYFHSIFDAFNQSLNFQRVYGLIGAPLPWIRQPVWVEYPQIKLSMKLAYQRLIGISIIYCGLHLDGKRHTMPDHVIKQVQQERMINLLQVEMNQSEPLWNNFQIQEGILLWQYASFVQDKLFQQFFRQLRLISSFK